MIHELKNFDWKLLRILVRAKGRPVPGRALRHLPTRQTKSGVFLGRLAEVGLIAVAAPADDPFQATYTLTDLGRHAAEYGEYEGPAPWERKPPAPPAAPKPGPAPAPRRRGKK